MSELRHLIGTDKTRIVPGNNLIMSVVGAEEMKDREEEEIEADTMLNLDKPTEDRVKEEPEVLEALQEEELEELEEQEVVAAMIEMIATMKFSTRAGQMTMQKVARINSPGKRSNLWKILWQSTKTPSKDYAA